MSSISDAPWYQNCTYPSWDIPLATDAGAEDITNVGSFKMVFRSQSGTDTVGTGAFTVKVNNPAEILYKPSPADVAAPFSGSLIITAYFPPSYGAADAAVYDPIPFVITGA